MTAEHDIVEAFLVDAAGPDGAAAHQACLMGHACASPATAAARWMQDVLGDLAAETRDEHAKSVLAAAASRWIRELNDGQMAFQLMLPDDDVDLAVRTEALAQWCQGFLLGMAAGGVTNFDHLPGDVPEFLRDVLAMTHAGADDAAETDEAAYIELVEYLRAGTQLVYDELATQTPAPTIQ